MSHISIIRDELTNDPVERGYSSMSDAEATVSFNTIDRTRNRTSMTGSEVMASIDKNEFLTLSPDKKQQVFGVLHMDQINPFGVEKDLFVDAFGAQSTTIATLAVLRVETIRRATELAVSKVKPGHVEEARR